MRDRTSPNVPAYELIRTSIFDSEVSAEQPSEECQTPKESEFRDKLEDAETPLYSTCHKYNKVSAITVFYHIKVKSGMSENFFDHLLTTIKDMLPDDNVLPRSTTDMKKFKKVFGFGYDLIHACKNDCILYRKQYAPLESCPICNDQDRKWINAMVRKIRGFQQRSFGIPIKDKLKRMFRSKRMAKDLRWHFNYGSDKGIMRHPVDSITWARGNNKWPEFAAEPRNLRLRPGHPYRRKKGWFDNTVKNGTTNRIHTGQRLLRYLKISRIILEELWISKERGKDLPCALILLLQRKSTEKTMINGGGRKGPNYTFYLTRRLVFGLVL